MGILRFFQAVILQPLFVVWEMIVYRNNIRNLNKPVILSEQSESKDLRTIDTLK